jgi:rhodanese-related sulfurtransferase
MNVMNARSSFLLLALFFLSGCNCSRNTPEAKTEEVISGNLRVINVLDKEFFDDCRIKGSVNIPFMDPDDPEKSPIDSYVKNLPKDTKLVVYCSNYMCTASGEITKKLKGMGFEDVWAYEAGMADWYQKGLPTEGSCKEGYLTKVIDAPKEHSGFKVISTEELKQMIDELQK